MYPITRFHVIALVLSSLCLDISQQAISQDRSGTIGIGIQLSTPPPFVYGPVYTPNYYYGPYFPTPAQGTMEIPADVLVSAWLTDQVAIEPSIGLMAYTNETQWRFGLAFVNHFGHEKLRPFVKAQAKIFLASNGGGLVYGSSPSKMTSYFYGLGVGGEYFVGEKFSVSGECQLNYLIPDKNSWISTGAALSCRLYLN